MRLEAQLPESVAAVVDEDALRQIVLNLLDNAAKYGPPGQEIRVGLEEADGNVRIWIDDEGPGVPIRDRALIWKRFRRLERDQRAAIAGTGIGLTVVSDLVTRLGGTVRVGDGERGGARFIVELPAVSGAELPGSAEEAAPGLSEVEAGEGKP